MDIRELKKAIINLSKEKLEELNEDIEEQLETFVSLPGVLDKCAEQRFAEGLVCPHCGKKNVVKYGRYGRLNDKPRFLCKDCQKTFGLTTKTVFADSKLQLSVWLKYAKCMSRQMTLRETAEEVGISLKCSFFMRHKILSAIKEHYGVDSFSGIIEMDETFFAESFKGNHKKGKPDWVAPRDSGESRKRGKQVDYRGISHEQVCVSTAIDRNNGLALVPVGKGRLTTKNLTDVYEGRIAPQSTICTDSASAYKKFAKAISAELIQIERGKHKKGVYHINNMSSLHSRLKLWMKPKYGVATKYLANYMVWFNWSIKKSAVSKSAQGQQLIYDSISSILLLTRKGIRETGLFSSAIF